MVCPRKVDLGSRETNKGAFRDSGHRSLGDQVIRHPSSDTLEGEVGAVNRCAAQRVTRTAGAPGRVLVRQPGRARSGNRCGRPPPSPGAASRELLLK